MSQIRPRRFPAANKCWELAGGNEDNYLWSEVGVVEDEVLGAVPATRSLFVPDEEQRAAISAGANISLTVIGHQPPVMMAVSDEQPGREGAARGRR